VNIVAKFVGAKKDFRTLARFAAIVLLCAGGSGCGEVHPLHPSYDELTKKGFYVYVLPATVVQERGWLEDASLWSYTFHCQPSNNGNDNPVRITYQSENGNIDFEIIIGNWTGIWEWSKPRSEVQLSASWLPSFQGEYYQSSSSDSVGVMFTDPFGIQVQVWSDYAIDETAQLISQLQYIGPDPVTVTNPWDNCD